MIGWFGGLDLACGPPVDYIYIYNTIYNILYIYFILLYFKFLVFRHKG